MTKKKYVDRFWSKVDIRGEDDCWEWQAGASKDGYGAFWDGKVTIGAHIFSYKLAYREVEKGLCVLHECDNPSCVNPKHLFLGTRVDNIQDMLNKGRQPYGERKSQAILNEKQVIGILNSPHILNKELVKSFGVVPQTINDIRTNRSWRHIPR